MDGAIAAVEHKHEEPAAPFACQVAVGPGRHVGLVVPLDLSAVETINLVAFLTTGQGLSRLLAEAKGPAGRLWKPGT